MHRRFVTTALACALLSLGTASSAFAQSGFGPAPTRAADTVMSPQDLKFMEKAAVGGLLEVELGKLAQQKALNEQVKQFGARMVKDHTKSGEDLKRIADAKGVTLPASLDKKHQRDVDELKKASGKRFDQEYMEYMVKDHHTDVREFEQQAKSGKNADLKNFASKTLPALQEHLKLAEAAKSAAK